MTLNKILATVVSVYAVMVLAASPVMADGEETGSEIICEEVTGSYGSVTKVCRKKSPEVLGKTVDAGIEDMPFAALAGAAGVLAVIFYIISKQTQRVYWLD